jgi:hypothetical protein
MTGLLEWLLTGNRFLIAVGICHYAVGIVARAVYKEPIEGLLLMILGILFVILAKMDNWDEDE